MENKIECNICNRQITITRNNINIKDSYKIRDPFTMLCVLKAIRSFMEDNNINMYTPLTYRSYHSMIREWVAHNNAYILGYKRERTGSVDLNYPQKWYVKVVYFICSLVIL